MKNNQLAILAVLTAPSLSYGFSIPSFGVDGRAKGCQIRTGSSLLDAAKVGIFFGTSTGSTEIVASLIKEEFGDDADEPFDMEILEGSVSDLFGRHDALIVGTPTWNTASDTERSGTKWDELYYASMQDLRIQGKKVAVFGLGDQESYGENFADAAGELHDVFEGLGCQMMGYTSQDGYEHTDSKSIRGDKFCGLICDMANQEEMTESRVENWVKQLRNEGFLSSSEGSDASAGAGVQAATMADAVADLDAAVIDLSAESVVTNQHKYDDVISSLERNSEMLLEQLESGSADMQKEAVAATETVSEDGFTRHYNPATKASMWTSPNGRKCFYTVAQDVGKGSSP